MRQNRVSQSFDRLGDIVPDGVDLEYLRDVVPDELPHESRLRDVLGEADGEFDLHTGRQNLPRIRPILVALAARAAGAEQVEGEAMYAAELLHLALQLHDLAFGRRGGKRRWLARKVVKRSASWLGGNHLTLRALELARHTRPEILGELVDTLRIFADGQAVLRELQHGAVPTMEDWEEHADAHTGALFAFCCRVGGWLAGADRSVVRSLGRYGRHLGRLWHVAEDIALLEDEDRGAHLLARALTARPMLPVVMASDRDPEVGLLWARLVQAPTATGADELAQRIVDARGLQGARQGVTRESWAARKALMVLDESRYRSALDRLARSLILQG